MIRRALSLFSLFSLFATAGFAGSLRFHGTASGDVDRVQIAIDAPARPADVGFDFTLEWWMKATTAENPTAPCNPGAIGKDAWRNGNVIFDRNMLATPPDFGSYGVAIFNGRVAFGTTAGATGDTLCGSTNVADNAWHYIAVTRRSSDGQIAIFVDGIQDGAALTTNAPGNISYHDGRAGDAKDPFLFIGGDKFNGHAYSGWIDDVRMSSIVRYTSTFSRPTTAIQKDSSTVLLMHFDELSNVTVHDESGTAAGPSNGTKLTGTDWSTDSPPFTIATHIAVVPVVASGLSSALGITYPPDGSGRIFVVQQGGQIRIIKNGVLLTTPFLDVSTRIACCGERGLLGLAFDPQYSNNGFFYVYYTRANDFFITIARYHVTSNPDVADFNSETILKTFDHGPFSNHNGGSLMFGPDGYLYAGVGDGGSSDDPNNNAQNINVLLGKILRLDVNAPPDYIPASNPFVGVAGADEIWAFGVRNPWRLSFDRLTGDLYIGDVGQGTYEEVDFQLAGIPGGQNYGWKVLEGMHCNPDLPPDPQCPAFLSGGSVLPIFEYTHVSGRCSITGGYLFRGKPNSFVSGNYFYADYCTAEIWRATPNGSGGWTPAQLVTDPGSSLTSFGEDEARNLYFTTGTNVQRIAPYTFTDVTPTNSFWPSVEALVANGVTSGCNTGATFCPSNNVTRAQMAVFVLRGEHGQTYLPPPATGTMFADVPANAFAAAWIEQIAREGITAGCGNGNFCPNDNIRRDQMAVFLLKARFGVAYQAPACTGVFTDVPCPSTFASWVEDLFNRGITAGCGGSNYCPLSPVTRGQMAAFVTTTFGLQQ